MPTKRATKKASKKGSAKKASAKKGSSKKAEAGSLPPNFLCVLACAEQFGRCLAKGVNPTLCRDRLNRCMRRCFGLPG